MRFKCYLVLFFSLLYTHGVFAQAKREYTQSRVLILLDRSSSMIQTWSGGKSKSKAADELILKLMDSVYQVNPDVEFSLRVFGHQNTVPENNCHDSRNEVPFAKDNRVRMAYRLEDIQPLGVTSIAYSLQQAALHDLVDEANNAYSILLITDGGESCGGDICEVMRSLVNSKVFFKPYIISLEDYAPLKATYACMGDYLQVLKESDMRPAVGTIVNAFRPVLKIRPDDYKEIQDIAARAPSVLKVTVPPPAEAKPPVVAPPPPPVVTAPVAPPPAPPVVAPVASRPAPVTIARLQAARRQALAVALPVQAYAAPVAVPAFVPKVEEIAIVPTPPVEKPVPPVVKPAPPAEEKPVRPAPEKIALLAPARLSPAPITLPAAPPAPPRVADPAFEPKIVEELPERPAPQKIGYAALSTLKLTAVAPGPMPRTTMVTEPPLPTPVIDTPIAPPPPPKPVEKIARLTPVRLRQFGIIVFIEERSFPLHAVPDLPPARVDLPAAPPVAKVPPVKITPVKTKPDAKQPEGKAAEYTMEHEEAKETTVEVYFTNGKGRFYTTTPQILLLDVHSGNLVKRFYRTVDPDGNPDPQTGIPVGDYNLTFSETRGLVVRNVKVEEHKKNKVIVKINPASLSFEYANAPGKPVAEFAAVVIERNKAEGKIRNQKCTERLEYEPGNYHVVINTFPQEVRNIDLDFDEHVITIAQPGFARFNAEGLNTITLYQRLGDKFLPFNSLNPNDPKNQPLRMQPGEYQVHYRKGPGGPSASEKVLPFIIKSVQEAQIDLN